MTMRGLLLVTLTVSAVLFGAAGALTDRTPSVQLSPELPVIPGLDADLIDHLDSTQLVRSDQSGSIDGGLGVRDLDASGAVTSKVLSASERIGTSGYITVGRFVYVGGDVVASGRVDGASLCILGDCRTAWPGGPFSSLHNSQGKVFEFGLTGNSGSDLSIGYIGGSSGPAPFVRAGDPADMTSGFLPTGTEVTYGLRFLLASTGGNNAASSTLLNAPVSVLQYGTLDGTFPAALRLQYVRDADGRTITEDWTTYQPGTTYIELTIDLHGRGAASGRAMDVTLTKDGGAAKTVLGVRYGTTDALLSALPPTQSTPESRALLAGAGRIVYP